MPNDAWNGTIMQIRVEANARGDVVDTIIFNVEVPHIKEWRAISSQVDLEINPEIVNLHGGALAIGHPLGASGARITGKAASLLQSTDSKRAVATMCIGGGMGISIALEKM